MTLSEIVYSTILYTNMLVLSMTITICKVCLWSSVIWSDGGVRQWPYTIPKPHPPSGEKEEGPFNPFHPHRGTGGLDQEVQDNRSGYLHGFCTSPRMPKVSFKVKRVHLPAMNG